MAELDIVVVNWNTRDLLRECLASIEVVAQADSVECTVTIVDNGSIDDSIPAELEGSGRFSIIRNTSNEGFGAACNQGAFSGTSKYILFLNPDTRVLPNAFNAALHALTDADKGIGIVGIKMIDAEGRPQISCVRRATLTTMLADAVGLSKFRPDLGLVMHDIDYARSQFVDQVIGAFFLIRRADFKALGGFDDRFFVYMDEVDLAKRAADRGLRSYFLADAVCYHKGNGATDQVKGKRLTYGMMSRCQYALKHFSPPSALLVILVVALVEPVVRMIQSLLQLSPSRLLATAEGTLRFYAWTIEKMLLGVRARRPWWA